MKLLENQEKVINFLEKNKDLLFNCYLKHKPEVFDKAFQCKMCEIVGSILTMDGIFARIVVGEVRVLNTNVYSYWLEANDLIVNPYPFPGYEEEEFTNADEYMKAIAFPKSSDKSTAFHTLAKLKKQF